MNKMQKLINELNKASELYYNGKESFLTDKEFDTKLEELKNLEQKEKVIYSNSPTINVGAPVLTKLNKIQIQGKPMLSLDKVHSAKEIVNSLGYYDLIASIKCDGLSVRLVYQDTDLVSANTRGNGYEGSDITEHIKHFLNVPLKIAKTGTYIIDGEAIIYDNDFNIINKNNEFKNNRNTASGALSLLDMSIVNNRRLSFIAWDIIEGASTWYYHYNLEEAKDLGFTVVPARAVDCTKLENEEINEINQSLLQEAKEKGIPCDGVVWKINDILAGNSKGRTEHHFLNAVAWKQIDEEYETTLEYIDYDVSRNGILTPVAVFKSIEIDSTEVSRASLHNLSIMEEVLGTPYLGQKLWVCKQNQIIPQVVRADKALKEAPLTVSFVPTTCPICETDLKIITSDSGVKNLLCPNENCSCRLINRIDHYCSKTHGLNIKGLSRKTIQKLLDWGLINGLADIYKIEQHRTEWESKDGFGKASVGKIIDSINAEGRHPKLDSFISALGIPLVGKVVSKIITKYYDTWDDFRAAVGGDWTEFEGIGPEISKAINNFDYSEADEIVKYLDFAATEVQDSVSRSTALEGKVFCVTGKMKQFTRDSIKADIESKGGKMVSSISSRVDYLITNSPESGTSKTKEAIRLGIPIISEEEYINLG